MIRPPWWVLLSSAAAPVLLIGGWTVAAAVQPAAYDPARDTISALAGLAASHRWIMTVAVAGLGACYMATGCGLRAAGLPGRLTLIAGGIATATVSVLPLPRVGPSQAHGTAALIGFVTLALWPLGSWRRVAVAAWGLRRRVAIGAGIALAALVVWFGASLSAQHLVGVSERVAAGAEALWPLVVVLSAYAAGRRPQRADRR